MMSGAALFLAAIALSPRMMVELALSFLRGLLYNRKTFLQDRMYV
jgi:hypothetical protein